MNNAIRHQKIPYVQMSTYLIPKKEDGSPNYTNEGRKLLHQYNLPRQVYEKWHWVCRWRQSKLQCQFPREYIKTVMSYYDHIEESSRQAIELNGKIKAAKAMITKLSNALEHHCNSFKPDIFNQNPENTELYQKVSEKLTSYETRLIMLQKEISNEFT